MSVTEDFLQWDFPSEKRSYWKQILPTPPRLRSRLPSSSVFCLYCNTTLIVQKQANVLFIHSGYAFSLKDKNTLVKYCS